MSSMRVDPALGDLLGLSAVKGEAQIFELGRMFQEMDVDGDQNIDIEEFVSYFGEVATSDLTTPRPGERETKEKNGGTDIDPEAAEALVPNARP